MSMRNCQSMEARIALLPSELIWEIARHILADADGAAGYIKFRATCTAIRSSLPDICDLGFCSLPQDWIMLCRWNQNMDIIFRYPRLCNSIIHNKRIKSKITKTCHYFIHLPTGQCVERDFPELETHSYFSTIDGLLILVNRQTHALRLFNPLTYCLSADLPPTVPMEKKMSAVMAVVRTNWITEQPTLMIALYLARTAYFAKPGEPISVEIQLPFYITCAVHVKGRFYCADLGGSIWEIELERKSVTCVFSQCYIARCWDIVLAGTEMLFISSNLILEGEKSFARTNLRVYKIDLTGKTIIPTDDIGNYAIFVGDICKRLRAFSVTPTTNKFIEGNSIYVCFPSPNSYIYRLKYGSAVCTQYPVDDYCTYLSSNCSKRQYWEFNSN